MGTHYLGDGDVLRLDFGDGYITFYQKSVNYILKLGEFYEL